MSAAGLSAAELDGVQKTWKVLNDKKQQSGMDILVTLYDKNAGYQDKFPKWKGVPLGSLPGNADFQNFAVVWMDEVNSLVGNLNNEGALVALIASNVSKHKPRGLTPQHYKNAFNLLPAYLDKQCGGAYDGNAKSGWTKTIATIAGAIEKQF